MLSESLSQLLAENIYSSDQDVVYWAGLLGEPFLDGNRLFFFDGTTLTVIGYPVVPTQASENAVSIRDFEALCLDNRPRFVNYYGPHPIDLDSDMSKSYSVCYAQMNPDSANVDLRLDLTDGKLFTSHGAREAIRRTRKERYQVWFGRRDVVLLEHILLLELFARSKALSVYDTGLLLRAVELIARPTTTVCEVRTEGRLVGFAVAHEPYPGRPFLLASVPNREYKHVTDCLYHHLIVHYRSRGCCYLGLGYSLRNSIRYFKSKWGHTVANPPFRQAIWMSGESATGQTECLQWKARLLLDASLRSGGHEPALDSTRMASERPDAFVKAHRR